MTTQTTHNTLLHEQPPIPVGAEVTTVMIGAPGRPTLTLLDA